MINGGFLSFTGKKGRKKETFPGLHLKKSKCGTRRVENLPSLDAILAYSSQLRAINSESLQVTVPHLLPSNSTILFL